MNLFCNFKTKAQCSKTVSKRDEYIPSKFTNLDKGDNSDE